MSRMLEALKQIEAKRPRPLVQEPISRGPIVESAMPAAPAAPDSSAIENSLAQAESAVISALATEVLATEEPDIYEEMAQYILTQLSPDRSAALLFTSPRDGTEQTETLLSLSKTLVNHFDGKALLLDALPSENGMRNEKNPCLPGNWGHLLEQLKTQYQMVLIDAPSLADAQTAAMLSQCDGVYLMIRLGYTTPYDVRQAVSVIQNAGGRLLGSIAVS